MEDLKDEQFDNLDSWVPKNIVPQYEREILNKLLKKKLDEERKNQADQSNPLLIGGPRGPGIGGGVPGCPRPHIIGDPYI
jgi:hypothetical protein